MGPRPMKENRERTRRHTFGVSAVAVADPALWVPDAPAGNVFHQLAVHLRPELAARGIGGDLGVAGQVENGWEKACGE